MKQLVPAIVLCPLTILTVGLSSKETLDPFTELAAQIKPAVVTISTTDRRGSPWGVGTGFIVDKEGIIATNFHVIGEHREFTVELADGTICEPTEILGLDRSLDLALFRIDQTGLPTLPLGDSSKIQPGQEVLSVGNPLGFRLSVSRGVIAAVRELELGDGRPMVQVAIPIEAGSSGSPIVNRNGEVLGILTIKSGGAIGFGVPVNALHPLLTDPQTIPAEQWFTVGMLDEDEWERPLGGNWRQRAGKIRASGLGKGFGGRMLCLTKGTVYSPPYDLEVEVKLEDESGAAGLVFASDGMDRHYGFYPTNRSLRLTCFNGPKVFDWNILQTIASPDYRPNEWNLLSVRFEQGGFIRCLVNNQVVIEKADFTLNEGWVGLCKFREPGAEFRNFRISPRLSPGSIPSEVRERAFELSQTLELQESLSLSELEEFSLLGPSAHQALLERAAELETATTRLLISAEQVRISQIILQLTKSLSPSADQQSGDLLHAALLVAKLDNPDFLPQQYNDRVDRLAQHIASHFPSSANQLEKLDILIHQLFVQQGFHGSTLDFHHRANSYLNEVIDDREGLPITLCLLLMELGKRIDLPIRGLATPGHFLALYQEPGQSLEESVIIDAFSGQKISRQQADELTGGRLRDSDFTAASDLEIISRILGNLIRSAQWDRDTLAILRYLDALLAINPADNYHRTLRAMTLYGEGRFDEALTDITLIIGNNREDPKNAPLLEIERRLLQDHRPEF